MIITDDGYAGPDRRRSPRPFEQRFLGLLILGAIGVFLAGYVYGFHDSPERMLMETSTTGVRK